MLRLTAIFVAVCVVLIAASLGAVVYLVFGLSGPESSIVALAVLTALALYNTVTSRVRDRSDVGDQIADLSRGIADLARQVAELGRRLATVENSGKTVKMRPDPEPLAAEIEELSTLVKQLAESVAAHETALAAAAMPPVSPPPAEPGAVAAPPPPDPMPGPEQKPAPAAGAKGPFRNKSGEEIVALIRAAIDAARMDLYLQPIVTLPQRKVRYYEGMTRLRLEDGQLVLPADFLSQAEIAGLMPRIDNMLLFRCVQVLRRLLLKNREVGLFCNISAATLQDLESFPQFLQFMDANRAIAPSLTLEFSQRVLGGLGPIEQESLAALSECGFRFSMDQVTDLRLDPRQLAESGIRFVKVPAALLLNRSGINADIHAADLSDLLGRHGISLIAERIETEAVVVDLLDYDVRFGQGFLFSPPRPVRPEALQGLSDMPGRETKASPPEAPARRDNSAPLPVAAVSP